MIFNKHKSSALLYQAIYLFIVIFLKKNLCCQFHFKIIHISLKIQCLHVPADKIYCNTNSTNLLIMIIISCHWLQCITQRLKLARIKRKRILNTMDHNVSSRMMCIITAPIHLNVNQLFKMLVFHSLEKSGILGSQRLFGGHENT